jgi:hypothetical protein
MLDQLHAHHPGVVIHGHHGVDRLARIAGGADEIRGDEGKAHGLAAPQDRHHGNILAHRPVAIGPRDQIGGGHLLEETGEVGLLCPKDGRQHQQQGKEEGQQTAHQITSCWVGGPRGDG